MAKAPAKTGDPESLAELALIDAGLRGCRVVVGLSGGVDSVALLHALVRIAPAMSVTTAAVHVHHGLSAHADEWARFCDKLCRDLGVELTEVRVHVDRGAKLGIEGAAREARYAVFREQRADAVALAHHADDQAETLLLQLLRGAGVRGLSAMPPLRTLDSVTGSRLLRPWLALTRVEIRAYASSAGLSWVEDESNTDETFDRSFLRARVLPALVARYPGFRETLGRAAQNLGDAAQLLDDLAVRDARGAVAGNSLAVSALAALSAPGARNLLRWFLEQQHLPAPTRDQLDEARRQALGARVDARVRVKVGAAWLRRHRGRLYLEPAGREPAKGWRVAWTGQHELTLPGELGCLCLEPTRGAGLSLARLRAEPVAVALRVGGERLRLAPNRPTRTLKNLLHEARVPEWERARLPLIFVGDTLVWVPGVGHDFRFAAAPEEPGVMPRWEHAGIVSA